MRPAADIRAEEYLQSFRGAEPLNTTSKVRRHPGSPYQRALSPGGPPPFVILRGGKAESQNPGSGSSLNRGDWIPRLRAG